MGSNHGISLRVHAMMAACVRWLLEIALEDMDRGQTKLARLRDSRMLTLDARQVPLKLSPSSIDAFSARTKGVKSQAVTEYFARLADDDDVYLAEGFFPWGGRTAHVLFKLKRVRSRECRPLGATTLQLL